MYNYGCCTPPVPPRDDCCCKQGITCALDWFFQDFLSPNKNISPGSLRYFPVLGSISNIIWGIPYISPDIVPTFVNEPAGDTTTPYCGDMTFLNICEIEGFSFELNSGVSPTMIANQIETRFSMIRYVSPSQCCCKNGLMEYLLKAKDFLNNPCPCQEGQTSEVSVTISTSTMSYNIKNIIAINPDTVWASGNVVDDTGTTTVYYVISLCKIVGITFNRIDEAVTTGGNGNVTTTQVKNNKAISKKTSTPIAKVNTSSKSTGTINKKIPNPSNKAVRPVANVHNVNNKPTQDNKTVNKPSEDNKAVSKKVSISSNQEITGDVVIEVDEIKSSMPDTRKTDSKSHIDKNTQNKNDKE